MPEPRCKHYKPRDIKAGENCVNCFRWVGIQCVYHSLLASDYESSDKFRALDRMMRDNKGVVL